jgi:hypothetical protein
VAVGSVLQVNGDLELMAKMVRMYMEKGTLDPELYAYATAHGFLRICSAQRPGGLGEADQEG